MSEPFLEERWNELMVKPVVKMRTCMKCRKEFKSQHTGQRICLKCKQSKYRRSELAEQMVILQ